MTVGEIANNVAFFLGKQRTDLLDGDGNDMVISAMNQARVQAESLFWFNNQRGTAWLSVSPNVEASLDDCKLIEGTTFTDTAARVKAVDVVYLGDDINLSSYFPVYVDSKKLRVIKQRERLGQFRDTLLVRYPTDSFKSFPVSSYSVVFNGRKLSLLPAFTTVKKVAFDVVFWMSEYEQNRVVVSTSSTASSSVTLYSAAPANFIVGTDFLGSVVTNISSNRLTITLSSNANVTVTSPSYQKYSNKKFLSPGNSNEDYSDWFTEYGHAYLFYSALVTLNLYTNTFVARAEGFNPSPERNRDAALNEIVAYDALMFEQGRSGASFRNR